MREKKIKMLAWSDAVTVQTGFGVVSNYVLKGLHDTGNYEIDQLAINYHGDFYDREECPYQLVPAKIGNPRDPYGLKMFGQSLVKKKYDIVWILNDTFVVQPVAGVLDEIRKVYLDRGDIPPMFVYYYPVDCKVLSNYAGMIDKADVPVAYTEFGINETLKVLPHVEGRLEQIYHGVNTSVIRPISQTERAQWRKAYLKVDDNTFVITNVNRNSVRKQIPHTLLAFKEFKKLVPNSVLYLHTVPKDGGIDLLQACKDLQLSPVKDVIFPANYSPSRGFPEEVLNRFFCCSDAFLTTHLGEGFGLTVAEAMAAGVPVIAPDNTNMYELLGKIDADEKRGWLYPCKDMLWVDNSGYRPAGRIDDIVNSLLDVYKQTKTHDPELNLRTKRAREWCVEHDWSNIGKQWVKLFDHKYEVYLDGQLKTQVSNVRAEEM